MSRTRYLRGLAGVAGLSAILLVATTISATPAYATPVDSITVDMSTNNGTPNTNETGFLYGLTVNGSGPANNLVAPLKPKLTRGGGGPGSIENPATPVGGWTCGGLSGYNARFTRVEGQYATVVPLGSQYELLLSDLWGDAGNGCPAGTVSWPGDSTDGVPSDYNFTSWDNFLAQIVSDISANSMAVRFDVWNEPDGWGSQTGRSGDQYFAMWDNTVSYLRAHLTSPTIVGPSYSGYDHNEMGYWLNTVAAAGALPSVLNWHFSGDPVADAADARGIMAEPGVNATLPLEMNEYALAPGADQYQLPNESVGYQNWYISRLQRAGFSLAEHAVWRPSGVGTLDNALTSSGQPKSQWWGYQRYAELGGTAVAVTAGSHTDALASQNSADKTAQILVGKDGSQTGDVAVNITGLGSTPYLVSGGKTHVILQQLPNTTLNDGTPAPTTVSSQDVTVTGSAVTVTIPWTNPQDGWEVILTPPGDSSALHLPLSDQTGTTATDSSTNAINGTTNNVTWDTNSKAASLNGTSSDISLGNPSALNFSGKVTLSAWIDPTSSSGGRAILYHHQVGSGDNQLFLRLNSGNLEGGTYTGSAGQSSVSTPFPSADLNNWTHVALTNDGTNWTLYINGVPESTAANTAGAVAASGNWSVGSSAAGDQYFAGELADARVYSRAETSAEIQADMTTRSTALAPKLQLGLGQLSGSTAYDGSGFGHDGTASNVTWANGAASFNGTSSTISLGNPSALNFTGAISLSAWIKPTSTTGGRAILYHHQVGSPDNQVFLRLNSGMLEGGSYSVGAGQISTSVTYPIADVGVWTHVTLTNDRSQWRLYINGALQASTAGTTGALTASGWAVGSSDAGDQYFAGSIADARIYDRAVSSAEINGDNGRFAAAIWPMQEGSGTSIADVSGNASTGTASGTSWTTSPLGSALSFAGAGTVSFGSPSALNINVAPITMMAWVKATSFSGVQAIVYRQIASGNYAQDILRINDGKLEGGSASSADAGSPVAQYTLPTADAGTWIHVAVTWDGSAWRLYVGSSLVSTLVDSNGPESSSGTWTVGATAAGDQHLTGSVYDARVYATALTAAEIGALSQ